MEQTMPSEGDDELLGVEGGSWHPALRPERHPSPRPDRTSAASKLLHESVFDDDDDGSEPDHQGSWHPAFRPERDSFPAREQSAEIQSWIPPPQMSPLTSHPIEPSEPLRDSHSHELSTEHTLPSYPTPAQSIPPRPAQEPPSPTLLPVEPSEPPPLQEKISEPLMADDRPFPNDWEQAGYEEDSFFKEGLQHTDEETSVNEPTPFHKHEPLNDTDKGLTQGSLTNGDHDFSWDEPDTVDPACGLARTETDLFSKLKSIERSNSFPEVPPLNQPQSRDNIDPIPASQAESMERELGYQEDSREFHEGNGLQGNSGMEEELAEPGNEFFDGLRGQDQPATPPEAESRFEEGLPLVPHESGEENPENLAPEGKSIDSFFGDIGATGDDFFKSIPANEEETMGSPPTLDRKSTSQVLRSMDYVAHHPNHHSKPFDPVPPIPAVADLQGRENERAPASEDIANAAMPSLQGESAKDSKDEDLDALWQAALGDDELLEGDDELLPDDEWSGSQVVLEDENQSFEKAMSETYADTSRDRAQSSGSGYLGTARPNAPRADSSSVSNPYAPHQPSSSVLTQPFSPYRNAGVSQSGFNSQTQPQRPAAPEQSESFADRSREGYQSPYDLPTGFTRPKKRIVQQTAPALNPTAPPPAPPRSSSMMAPTGPPRLSPSLASAPNFSSPQVQLPIQGRPPPETQVNNGPSSLEKPKPRTSSSSFFEELPMVIKPRPSMGMGRITPQQALPTPPPSRPAMQTIASPPTQLPPQSPADPYSQYQLQPPERLDPYTNAPQPAQSTPSPAGLAMRYSPRPPSNNAPPPTASNSRYSPAPPSQAAGAQTRNKYGAQPAAQPPPPPPNVRPFQPRTSSPLAVHERNAYQGQPGPAPANVDTNGPSQQSYAQQPVSPVVSRSAAGDGTVHDFYASPPWPSQPEYRPSLPSVPSQHALPRAQDPNQSFSYTANEPSQPAMPFGASPPGPMASYGTQYQQAQGPTDLPFSPPRRSQTQSPGKRSAGPPISMAAFQPPQRAASVHDPSSPTSMNPYATFPVQSSGRARGLTQNMNFVPPSDGTEHDPLQRWRGSAIAGFGFGGILLSTVPRHIPRYTTGATVPMIKSSPGEIRLQSFKDILPLEDKSSAFPGPLKAKSKKKDVISWLSSGIDALEKSPWPQNTTAMLPDPRKRHEEKIILWKIMRVMVEFDGQLEGNVEIQKSLSKIISSEFSVNDGSTESSYMTGAELAGISRSRGSMLQPEPMDPAALETVRKALLNGDRKKAVWDAVDRRLWAHAMLISSTVDKDIWKQVVQEFVRQEVKLVGENTEPLAALYEIFAGNWQESIDELVPPSARAGLQMVSKVASAGPTKNALDGLDRWRETLALVLSNRVPDDHQALAALGNLLAGYGRVEAAHICHLFARSSSLPNCFGGVGDPQAKIVLLGADHQRLPLDFARDEDSVLLTEVYEFAVSILASSTSGSLPHFQAYKLQRAVALAENGFKSEAQQYCDAIDGILKSTTKMSPYYTPQLFEHLKDLSDRLRQAPSEGTSSWIFNPSMGKVSGSLWGKFSNFVAGDESDGESRGSGKGEGEFGPFAKVVGTPTISRSGSQTDLHGYGSYPMAGQGAANTSSRYAPAGPYAPRSSLEQPRSSLEQQRSPPYVPTSFSQPPRHETLEPTISNVGGQFAQQPSPYQPMSHSPNESAGMFGYQPTPPQTSHSPMPPAEDFRTSNSYQGSYFPTPPNEHSPSFEGHIPHAEASPEPISQLPRPEGPSFDSPMPNDYGPPSNSYEPPSYTPPTYEPDTQPDTDSPAEERPKKKSFMDDDDEDDFAARAAAIPKAEKVRKDREADEAFRKAAEGDANKPELNKKPSGWFGGWFGKKDPNAPGTGPIKAKLGEESSFVYDPELKKWVNKKDPNSAATGAKSTPPPPRGGPPSRSTSGMGGPPPMASGPPRSASSNFTMQPSASAPSLQPSALMPSLSGPPALTPTPPSAPGPPSRTASPLISSTPPTASAQSIAPPSMPSTPALTPGLPPGLAPPSAPTSRPGTAMSSASSIDDLLGAPQARKAGSGGTVKGKRKGRGYVDVMAK